MEVAKPSSARFKTERIFENSPLTPLYSTPRIHKTIKLQRSPVIPNTVFLIDFVTREPSDIFIYYSDSAN